MEKIGPYKIIRTIASGGMGEVYLAALERRAGFQKTVALKCMLPELVGKQRFTELFEREARLAAVLSHRNIVEIFDFGHEEDRVWLAMEYVDGVDLKRLSTRAGTIPLNIIVEIGIQAARGLAHAHQARDASGVQLNIIHRDVSPQNILLSYQGDVKLADFGLAHAAATGLDDDRALKGKFAYMSPEQVAVRALDERTDQFSLGVVLAELLSGRRAFHDPDGIAATLSRITEGRMMFELDQSRSSVPEDIRLVIKRTLAVDRRERFADLGQFAAALESAANRLNLNIGTAALSDWLATVLPQKSDKFLSLNQESTERTAVADAPILSAAGADSGLNSGPGQVSATEDTVTFVDENAAQMMGFLAADGNGQSAGQTVTMPDVASPTSARVSNSGAGLSLSAKALYPLILVLMGAVLLWLIGGPREHIASRGTALTPKKVDASLPFRADATPPVLSASAHQVDDLSQAFTARTVAKIPVTAQEDGKVIKPDPAKLSKGSSLTPQRKAIIAARPQREKKRRLKPMSSPRSMAKKSTKSRHKRSVRSVPKKGKDERSSTISPASIEKADVVVKRDAGKSSQASTSRADKPSQQVKSPATASATRQTTGPRIRPWGGATSVTLRGQARPDGWYAIPERGQLLSASQNGIRLFMRVFGNRDRIWAAINSKPSARLTVNGTHYGDTPIASVPLRSGVQEVLIMAGDGRELRVRFKAEY